MTVELDITLTDIQTGRAHRLTHWSEYSVTSDLMGPADSFSATLAAVEHQRAFTDYGGQLAKVFSYGALQCKAIVDERSEATAASNTDLQITGRGMGGLLLDNVVDAAYLRMSERTLEQVANRITTPYRPDYITEVVTNNAANRYMVSGQAPSYSSKTKTKRTYYLSNGRKSPGNRETDNFRDEEVKTKVRTKGTREPFGKNNPEYRGISTDNLKQTSIGPEERIWDVIMKLSKQIACLPFVGADGTLIITRPCYAFDSTAYGEGIVQLWDRKASKATGGNVMQSQFETSIATRHSEIVAWATGKANKTAMGKALLKHTWSVKDPGPAFWRRQRKPPYLTDRILYKPDRKVFKNLKNEKLIRRVCRSMFEERVIAAFSLEYMIAGHTIGGQMPVIDSMINVHDERYGLTERPYYITRVERRMNATDGRTTTLKLIPPEIWLHVDHDKMGDLEYTDHMTQRIFW